MSTFIATPTQEEFMLSDAFVRVLAGPIGGGKSVCCTHELFRWSTEQRPNGNGERKTRFLIVRNTADQLRSTVMKTVFDWFPPQHVGEWKATEKTLYIDVPLPDGTRVKSEWMFIALDTPDDVRKALSLEATGLWGNESRELHKEVVEALLGRVDRYPSMKDGGATRAGALFDTNMPDQDTYWHNNMENPPANWSVHIQPPAIMKVTDFIERYGEEPDPERRATAFDGVDYCTNPDSDNYANLSKKYYPNNIPGRTQDFLNVYLRCRYGRSLNGTPVYDQTFVEEFHLPEGELSPIRGENYPIVIGLDFGRTPAAVLGQLDHRGRVLVFDELVSENMGIEKFLSTKLKPHLFAHYAGFPTVVAPDPAGWAKTQVGEVSPVDVVKAAGFTVAKPASNSIEPRIQAVERLLTRQVDGKAAFLVNRRCKTLVQGFKYGYRWRMDKSGNLMDHTPDKNAYSHIHDALQYFAQVVDQGVSGSLFRKTQRREVMPARVRFR
jgi:hypothetical protein